MSTTAYRPMSTTSFRLTPAGVLRSERTKLWSLRSTRYTIGIIVVLIVGLGVLMGATFSGDGTDDFADPVATPMLGVQLSTVLIGVLGVLATAGERDV